ncbi:ABC transporter substrate-binding protein [Pigmentiphaga soli]|uniref:ABC transporter substrate-binding protein n=1 Tax=Pigmentiphaga soli TaxID=1007095 RepID=A0ABP8GTU5_9BURK
MKPHWTKFGNRFVLAAGLAVLSGSATAQTIKIGWLSSLTGALSAAAQAENLGVQMAVEEINQGGGILGKKIELLTRDTAGDPTKAVNFAQQLAFSEKVQAVVGPVNSGEALASTPVLARAGVPNIVISTVDELTDPKKYPRAFRVVTTNQQWIGAGNDYALKTLRKTRIAVFADTSGFGANSAKLATSLMAKEGVKPVYSVLMDANKTDVTDEMNKAKAAGAEVLLTWTSSTGLLARILNARGGMAWNVPVIGHPSLMATQVRQLLNKPEYWQNTFAPGYQNLTYGPDGKLPERTKALMDKMRPRLGGGEIDLPFWWVAMGYDTVKVIEHAIKSANSTDPAAIQKALENTKGLEGVYATYTWGPAERNGYPDGSLVVNAANTFKDGAFQARRDKPPYALTRAPGGDARGPEGRPTPAAHGRPLKGRCARTGGEAHPRGLRPPPQGGDARGPAEPDPPHPGWGSVGWGVVEGE